MTSLVMCTFIIWINNIVFARFLHSKVTISPFLYSILWNPVTKFHLYSRGGEIKLHLLGLGWVMVVSAYYLKFFCKQHLSFISYLFIQSFIYSVLIWVLYNLNTWLQHWKFLVPPLTYKLLEGRLCFLFIFVYSLYLVQSPNL